jgi:hypothetical protein
MTSDEHNRMADTERRKPGRPPNTKPSDPVEAMPVVLNERHVPPINCPCCGRGMTPIVLRWVPDGTAACTCRLCGKRFNYTPPKVRVIV